MKRGLMLLCTAVAGCGHTEPQLSAAEDLQRLVETALAVEAADARTGKRKVCVQRAFDAPLNQTVEQWQTMKIVPTDWYANDNRSGNEIPLRIRSQIEVRLQRAVTDAIAGRAQVTRASAIASVPQPLILDSSKPDQESECEREMPHGLESPKPNGPRQVTLTRPVFVDGFALIEYASSCGGLCYGSSLRAFQNQNGKWTYVASTPLAVG